MRLYPVGRLDADSSGLILLTNDGELANRLTHPSFEVPKTYRATLGGPADRRSRRCGACARACSSTTGRRRPARARRLGEHEIELTIHEGRNRQVRRMCDGGRASGAGRWCACASARCAWTGWREGEHRPLSERELGLLRAL